MSKEKTLDLIIVILTALIVVTKAVRKSNVLDYEDERRT